MRAVLVIGPPGAGKTTTLTRLMGALEADSVRYAAVEVEALALVHPWPDDDAGFDHLRFVARSFERRGYPLLLVSATVTDTRYFERMRDALPTDDFFTVRLTARPETLRARVRQREPVGWVGLPRLLDAAQELAEAMAALPDVDLVLDTETDDVDRIVAGIRRALQT